MRFHRTLCVWIAILGFDIHGQDLRVAVAANFLGAMQELTKQYEAETGRRITISSGSSGALYAQIVNGAPFDVFFSADSLRPLSLVSDGMAFADSRWTYALGVLVLWSPDPLLVDSAGSVLRTTSFRHLSIADPRNAPYGTAAQQVLMSIGVWKRLVGEKRVVRAQSIAQAYSQIASGAASLGFVAWAQVKTSDGRIPGSYWFPPPSTYLPIVQQAVILRNADMSNAELFVRWLQGDKPRRIIENAGYLTP